jgi:hypothetical protein
VVVVMGGGAWVFLSFFLPFFSLAPDADVALVVNELYYDHPGVDAGHEYVEILNTGDEAISLDGVVVEFHNGTGTTWTVVWRAPGGLVLHPDELFVVGGFAVVPPPNVVFELALQNGPDAIRLLDRDGLVLDLLGYGGLDDPEFVETQGAAVADAGESVARTPDGRDTDDNASDFAAAAPTPGRRNVARDDAALALSAGMPAHAGRDRAGVERVAIDIRNLGLVDIPASAVVVTARDSSASGIVDVGTVDNAALVAPGEVERVAVDVLLSGDGYHWIDVVARYALDERSANDRVTLVRRVGRPGLLVSEIMSAPRGACPQFVELYNAGSAPIDLTGFALRDTHARPAVLATDSLILEPRGLVVATKDEYELRSCASLGSAAVVEVDGSWPAFNKSGDDFADSVLVLDRFAIPVDAVSYPGVDMDGHSLERVDVFVSGRPRDAVWRLSNQTGGSPGGIGDASLERPPLARCEVSPNPFFPESGDVLRIAIASASEIARVVVCVYDSSGRRVIDVGSASSFPAVLLWEGRGADNELVRSGVYVLACEGFAADGTRVGVEKVVVGCARRSP